MRRKVVHAVLGVSLMAAVLAVPQATVGAQTGWTGFTAVSVPSGLQGGGANDSPAWTAAVTTALGGAGVDVWVNNHGERSEGLEDYIGGGAVFTDATISTLTDADTHGALFTDIDGDGDEDLIEVMGRDNDNVVWRNTGGILALVPTPGIADNRGRGRQAISFDLEGDGDMDILVGNLDRTLLSCDDGDSDDNPDTPECSDHDPLAEPDPIGTPDAPALSTMYTNDGTGVFTALPDTNDAIDDGNIRYLHLTSTGPATDQLVLTSNTFVFALNSLALGSASVTAAGDPVNSIAFAANNMTKARDIALGDIDGDLAPEAVVARQEDFLDDTGQLGALAIGVGQVSTSPLSPRNLTDISDDARIDNCRSVALADYDNDGDIDIFAGCTQLEKTGEAVVNVNSVLLNDGAGNFTINSDLVPATTTDTAAVVIAGDFNNDGWVDTYVGTGHDSQAGPDFIFLNNGDGSNHWLEIDLVDGNNPDVAGAQVFVGTDKWQVRETGHRLHSGQDMKTLHFGLGSESFIAPVEIQWPDGSFSSCVVEGVDQKVTITKGANNCTSQTSGGLLTTLAADPDRTPPEMCNGLIVTVDLGEGETPTAGNDVILGTEQADTINSLGGDDVICALGGNDVINAGAGDDTVFGDGGNDNITGGVGRDFLRGGAGDDTIDGGDENDRIFGDDGNDMLFGQDGRDVLQGGIGNDTIEGGLRNDRISGNGGSDTLIGGNGRDRIDGQAGPDTLNGGGGNDRLLGGGGTDRINGKVGFDRCGEGEDVVNCEAPYAG